MAKAQVESLLARFRVSTLDLVQLPPAADPQYWAAMKEAKKEGRVRYLGAAVTSFGPYPLFESVMRNEPLDFISVDYCIDRRGADEKILPLARERKIAVLTIFPFGGANGASCASNRGLFARVANTPLPAWAAEFDAKTWAQFFLKFVISHPAVTVTRTGTTKAHHILDNIGGGMGRLPDEAMRKRMAAFIDALPAIVPVAILERYVGEYRTASGTTFTFRRDGEALLVKSGAGPEAPLIARSMTRFSDPRGPVFEFQVTGPNVTGLIMEQGAERIPLSRK
jgi:diketogulonate reductase-like aldo/keto reductase